MDYFYYIKCYFLWQSLDILCASYLPNNFAEMLQSIQSNNVIRWVIHSDLHIAPFYFIVFVDEQGEWHTWAFWVLTPHCMKVTVCEPMVVHLLQWFNMWFLGWTVKCKCWMRECMRFRYLRVFTEGLKPTRSVWEFA